MKRLQPKRSRLAVYILLLAAVGALMAGIRNCSPDRLPPLAGGDSQGDTIDVAIVYGPLSYYMWGDTLGGLNYDMLRRMGHDIGRPVRFWPVVKVAEGLSRLENGHFDLLASLPASNELKNRYLCTGSVFLDRLMLVQLTRPDSTVAISSALDLAGDTVYISANSSARSRIENLSREIGSPIAIVENDDLSEEYLCMKVAGGETRNAVVNEKTALAMKRKYPRLNADSPISFTQFQVWVLQRADTELLSVIDSWLESFKTSPSCKTLIDRYSE